MQPAPFDLNDPDRLADLFRLDILDTAAEKSYDDLATLLGQVTACPMALISFVDDHRQWVKARHGINLSEIPSEQSFCIDTLQNAGPLVIEDLLNDPSLKKNPLVGPPNFIRFYAGTTLLSPMGHKVGSVCVMDRVPRSFTAAHRSALTTVANQVGVLLELRMRNKQLLNWSGERERLDKATIQRQIMMHEQERELIGYELHENFAQTITASIQYLHLVHGATPSDQHLLERTRKVLTDLLNGVRQLSTSVFPIGRAGVLHEAIFEQYIEQFSKKSGIPVSFAYQGDIQRAGAAKLLTLFRIMVEQLQTFELREHSGLRISVVLSVDDDIQFSIATDGEQEPLHREERQVVVNGIINRSLLQQGRLTTHLDDEQNEVMTVHLPL